MSDYGQRLEALAAARTFLTNNGVRIDEASVRSLTADIFNETSLAGSHEAFAQAFTTLAKQFHPAFHIAASFGQWLCVSPGAILGADDED